MMNDAGRSFGAALALCLCVGAGPVLAKPLLEIVAENDTVIGTLDFAPGQEICLTWSHSVTGGKVADCFENRRNALVLTRSYLHDFAAGLGEVEGRGTIAPAPEGGYWITGIDETIPDNALTLRIGTSRVGHVLSNGAQTFALSDIAAGARVLLRLRPDPR